MSIAAHCRGRAADEPECGSLCGVMDGHHSQTARPVRVQSDWLYLEPVTGCNLRCSLCYTAYDTLKNSRTVPREQLLRLVTEYMDQAQDEPAPGLYWCGTGEIFFYPGFVELVNEIADRFPILHHSVQTNGTVMPDPSFRFWDRMTFNVSIDGLQKSHEENRGSRTYEKSLAFARHVVRQGASLWVRCLVTRGNVGELRELEAELLREVGASFRFSATLPYDNATIDRAGSRSLRKGFHGRSLNLQLSFSHAEAVARLRQMYDAEFLSRVCPDVFSVENGPPPIAIYPAVAVDGIYTCCERIVKIGELGEDLAQVIARIVPATCDGCGMAETCRT
jgi:MoaA/NifB/PqqE/SkfB family radical SAM enzyme